jgi:hypothetical protein
MTQTYFEDNEAAILMANTSRQANPALSVHQCAVALHSPADPLTKALGWILHHQHVHQIRMASLICFLDDDHGGVYWGKVSLFNIRHPLLP